MLLLTHGTAHVFKIPDDEFVIAQSSGRWGPQPPASLKPQAAVRAAAPVRRHPASAQQRAPELPQSQPINAAIRHGLAMGSAAVECNAAASERWKPQKRRAVCCIAH
jgi:hypothetical protein